MLSEVWLYNNRPGQIFGPNLSRGVEELTPWWSKLGNHGLLSLTEVYPLSYKDIHVYEGFYRDWYRPINCALFEYKGFAELAVIVIRKL